MDSNKEIYKTPPKRQKQECVFQDIWLKDMRFKQWLRKTGVNSAHCSYCNSTFTVKHEGIKAVTDHNSTTKHKTSVKAHETLNSVKTFFLTKNTIRENKVILCELIHIYDNVMHHNSYLSLDCELKLASKAFPDSSIAKKLHCGRTKAEMIVKNVLYSASIEIRLNELNKGSTKKFSISTDASNKGNIKLFPIVLKFFSKSFGAKEFIIDIIDDSKEDSLSIFNNLKKVLESNDLSINNIVSYTADNASVNYGKNKSVFKNLISVSKNIVKANCNCHVIHNSAKFGCKILSFDVETRVLKVLSEFSSSAKNIAQLKIDFKFIAIDYKKLLKHVPTRWLTLFYTLDRLIQVWPVIKHYFLTQGEEEVAPIMWNFIKDQESEISPFDELTLAECYIHFVRNYMSIFNEALKQLESNSIEATDLFEIMLNLKNKIITRIEDEFFGINVNRSLESLTDSERNKLDSF
jgi:hypothetical protein